MSIQMIIHFMVSVLSIPRIGICITNSNFVIYDYTACENDEFECDRSLCIPMDKLCNSKLDCNDLTDESNCSMYSFSNSSCNYTLVLSCLNIVHQKFD